MRNLHTHDGFYTLQTLYPNPTHNFYIFKNDEMMIYKLVSSWGP